LFSDLFLVGGMTKLENFEGKPALPHLLALARVTLCPILRSFFSLLFRFTLNCCAAKAYHNQFTGQIPSELGLCSSIKRIGMYQNFAREPEYDPGLFC